MRVAPEGVSGGRLRMGRSTKEESGLSEQRRCWKFTAKQKLEIVVASLRGDRSVAELCRVSMAISKSPVVASRSFHGSPWLCVAAVPELSRTRKRRSRGRVAGRPGWLARLRAATSSCLGFLYPE